MTKRHLEPESGMQIRPSVRRGLPPGAWPPTRGVATTYTPDRTKGDRDVGSLNSQNRQWGCKTVQLPRGQVIPLLGISPREEHMCPRERSVQGRL